jgi:hypothetical protein
LSTFRPWGGSLDRRVNCRCVPSPDGLARDGTRRGRKNLGSVLSCARVGALAVAVYKRSRGREEERVPRDHPPCMRAMSLPFIDARRGSRVQWGCSNMLTCLAERSRSPMYMPTWLSERCYSHVHAMSWPSEERLSPVEAQLSGLLGPC